ncbi:MAG: DUF2878 domain-containing protein [Thiolinea sp.]
MSRTLIISNFVLFQLGWLACVLGGANQLPLAGSLVAATVIAIHIWRAGNPMAEIRLVISALIIGLIFESLLTLNQISRYPSGVIVEGFAPHWMVMMWGLFATTMNVSMRWVNNLSLPLIILLGAVLAPLSYLAGNRLQGVMFTNTTTALLWIAAGWAVLFPLLTLIAKRNNGYSSNKLITENDDRSYANV